MSEVCKHEAIDERGRCECGAVLLHQPNAGNRPSKPESFDIGYPLEEAIADANSWLRGTTMYEGMRGWKAALSVILADRDRLTKREAVLVKALEAVNSEAHARGDDDIAIYNIVKICRAALKEQP